MSKITFNGSNLEAIQNLANSLFTKMGTSTYSWNYGANKIICQEAFDEVNNAIDAVENSYTTGNSSKTCFTNYGTVNQSRSYSGGLDYSTNNTVYSAVRNRVESGYNFSNCTSFG